MIDRRHRPEIVVAFTTPIALLAIAALFSPAGLTPWRDPALLVSKWVYMATPSILALLIAIAVRPAQDSFLPAALLTATGLLVTYQLWVWLFVPVVDSALAWVFYHPAAGVVMLAVGLGAASRSRSRRRAP